jgi:signal transduction histidine kinase
MNAAMPLAAGQRTVLHSAIAIVLTAIAYFIGGRLGLLMAIPPGYASAVWPASGIALGAVLLAGYRVLPGVWLGSVAVNAPTALVDGEAYALLLPASIGLGVVMQAAVGAMLVRRLVGYRNLLEQEIEVVPTLLLGGPLACLISASVGIGTLFTGGQIPLESVWFNWWTWWVGDSIGVLIFTPLLLIWSLRPLAYWRRRQLSVTVPLAVLFGAVVWLFLFTSAREQARMRTQFEGWSNDIVLQVDHAMQQHLDALNALQAFYASSNEVTGAEFNEFAGRLLLRREGLLGLSWNPWVPQSERAAYERRQRVRHGAGFSVLERDANGAMRVAGLREFYAPVEEMTPGNANQTAIGFDVLSEPKRADAARHALDTEAPTMTAPLRLIQNPQSETGALVLAPVRRPDRTLAGLVAAAFDVSELIPLVRGQGGSAALELTVEDVTGGPSLLLYRSAGALLPAGLSESREIDVGGRRWRLSFSLPEQYLVAHRSWEAWTLLAAGMLFTGLLGMFLLVIVGRDARVARLVEQRTAQLQEANRGLAREAARSDRLETESRARADQLAATNRELEQFAFVVSHDLQAPLRNIQSFVQLLGKRHGDSLTGEAAEFLGFIRSGAADMERMIADLLQLSRVNPRRAQMERVRAGDALAAALASLRADLESQGARVEHGELPEVYADASLLAQLFQNLIANAIKFQRKGVPPVVQIGAELVRGEWRFAVADNGIGISEKNIGRLFQIFKRLHTAEEYPGTGIGLALCKKVVALHGGRIWVESRPGEGSTFFFTLPLQAGAPASGGAAG